jgi:hypothetical protein
MANRQLQTRYVHTAVNDRMIAEKIIGKNMEQT